MPAVRRIGRANADFQRIEALKHTRAQRTHQRRFLVEGVRAIERAVSSSWPLDAIVHAGARSTWARELLKTSDAREHIELPAELMDRLSDKEEPSELVAVARMPDDDLTRIAGRDDLLVVVLDRPSSPGNLGTIVRAADSFGAHGVIVSGHGADPYDPIAVRASQGSVFSVPIVRADSGESLDGWLSDAVRRVVGAAPDATAEIGEVDLRRPLAIVFGNEARGLSEAMRARCSELARIPMSGAADSLNVALAAAIFLYEARVR